MDSILDSTKKLLGIEQEYTHFDQDIILNINFVFMFLNQIGIGPENGFSISSNEETWVSFLGERKDLEAVKTYIYLKVRLVFDPPSSSFVLTSIEKQISEIEWRLNVQAER